MREIHDHYFHQAKREGFLSRAAFKLIEIDDRKQVLQPGDRVLDCGAAPGSWLQVAARRVGPRGVVIGIDLKPILAAFAEPNIRTVIGDFCEVDRELLASAVESARARGRRARPAGGETDPGGRFDVILSDMAPGTTGDPTRDHFRSAQLCERLLDRCSELLRRGGNLVMKVYEGETYPALLARTGEMFESVKGFKPKASRSESVEMYVVAHGYQGVPREAAPPRETTEVLAPPRRKPSKGWGTRARA